MRHNNTYVMRISMFRRVGLMATVPPSLVIAQVTSAHNVILSLMLLLAICTFPGYAFLELLKFKFENQTSQLFYAVMLSLTFLMVIFAALSVCLHYLDISHPINARLVAGLCDFFLIASVLFLLVRLGKSPRSPFKEFSWMIFSPRLFSMVLPCISLICVNRLNIHSDATLTTSFLIFLIALLIISGFDFVRNSDRNLQAWIIYGVSLSVILGSSFRGTGGFWGYDINSEYFSASKILISGSWLPPHASSAYDSMLSITVLPVVLSLFSKLSLTIIFKLFYPLVLALIPTVAYSVCTRFVSKFVSIIAVGSLIIGSISFIPQLPALAREEVGLAFFVGIIFVISEEVWTIRQKTAIGLLMAGGMSFSHYSTAYIASILFGFCLLVHLLLLLLDRKRFRREKIVFSPAFALAVILLTVVWNGVITHSLQDTKPIFTRIATHGLSLLPNSNQNLFTRWVTGINSLTSTSPSQLKINDLYIDFKNHVTPFPDSLSFVPEPIATLSPKPIFGASLGSSYLLALQFGRFFFQAFGVLGIGFMLRKYFRREKNRWKILHLSTGVSALDIFPIGIGAVLLGFIARSSSTLASFYNPERAAIQLEVVLLLTTAIALEHVLFRRGVAQLFLATPVVVFFLSIIVSATSLDGYLDGGDVSRISNLNVDLQPFVISASEIQASRWLNATLNPYALVQTDSRGFLVLDQVGRHPRSTSIDPYSLIHGSYVYASNSNVEGGIVRSGLIYKFPTPFINNHFQTIYSSSQVRIYH